MIATWKDRLVAARFSAEEMTEFERLVDVGLDRDEAIAELLRRRRERYE